MPYQTDFLLRAYRSMKTIREFEERCVKEFEGGNVPGFTHVSNGQEAIAVAACIDLSDKDIIGGSYRKKTDNEELYVVKALDKDNSKLNLSVDKDGILEVAGLGCGFMKISRKAMNALWEISKPYTSEKGDTRMVFEVVCEDGDLISEDIYMCKKWRNLGNSIYLDTNITCSHTGAKTFVGDVGKWINSFKNQNTFNPQPTTDLSKYFVKNNDEDDFKVLV